MFSALVVLNLFGADLILETIHLSVCWRFLNGLKPRHIPSQQGGISLLPGSSSSQAFGVSRRVVREDLFCWKSLRFHFTLLEDFSNVPVLPRMYSERASARGGR